MGKRWRLLPYFVVAMATAAIHARAAQRADAVLLVNSASARYSDAQQAIRPYLDNFGVPYVVLDIATTAVPTTIKEYALIIIGHRGLDTGNTFLSAGEQQNISEAVRLGSGLINFDNDLSANGVTPRYQFIQSVFGFGYVTPQPVSGVTFPADAGSYYVTSLHSGGEMITTASMTSAGITLPGTAHALVNTTSPVQPFLVSATYQTGRAIQWANYDWVSPDVKGPMYGLDALVWRSMVWAARKPFTMRGLPNILTMRVDDTVGSFWYVHTANQFGLKPWLGLFYQSISNADAADLSSLVHSGNATASVHSEYVDHWFFWDHFGLQDWPDATMNSKFDAATAWHTAHDVPISKYALGHFYEAGTNVFARLQAWGVSFVGVHQSPGQPYDGGSRWVQEKPYRLYASPGYADNSVPVYYADFLTVPGHPELQNTFFNCVTEIRDDAGYEWYPDNDVTATIGRGTRQVKRAFDSMALGTLFTHEQHIAPINPSKWSQELQGIMANLAPYAPRSMTMDDACRYIRAVHTSSVASSVYDPATRNLTTSFTGNTDVATQFNVFTEQNGNIVGSLIDTPAFSGSTVVVNKLPGALHHIVVSPDPGKAPLGGHRQFAAQGYDVDGIAIPGLSYAWSLAGGGTIDASGMVTAGSVAGTYAGAVSATSGGVTGTASLVVYTPAVDHFTFDPIETPVFGDTSFEVTIRAFDQEGNPFTSFIGPVTLHDTTATVFPSVTGTFAAGFWTGNLSIGLLASNVTLMATSAGSTGTSPGFDVIAPASGQIPFNCWEDNHQDPALFTTSNAAQISATDGAWTEFLYACCRPYPTVMAASGETALGLPVMRYYDAGVQNGTYDVFASLYTNTAGRNMRYYFGYQPATPKASHVDVFGADGDAYQHHEYDLGTVDVVDGTFSIYVQDADLLAGSYPFFGWANIRLVQQCTATKWYRDADEDGYGSPSDRRFACTAPDGYVANSVDCNDASTAVHPGASDGNCNGIDENCNGVADDGGATACNDFSSCTKDTCTAGACAHTDVCSMCTGMANGTPCNDVDSCTTGDHCTGGVCGGSAVPAPGEISGVVIQSDKSTIAWTPAAGPGVVYDVVRGTIASLPVGALGGIEVCLANDLASATASDSVPPQGSAGFWYLVRAANACGRGTYGFDQPSGGSPMARSTSSCP